MGYIGSKNQKKPTKLYFYVLLASIIVSRTSGFQQFNNNIIDHHHTGQQQQCREFHDRHFCGIEEIKDDDVYQKSPQRQQMSRMISSRRTALFAVFGATTLSSLCSSPALAKTGSIKTAQFAGAEINKVRKKIDPNAAFDSIQKARSELIQAQALLKKGDTGELQDYLSDEAVNMKDFEDNLLSILNSSKISDEAKKDIGTIRRYGVGADVMIMYGGLTSELEASFEPNIEEVTKYLTRTLQSLDEVIAICKNEGFA